MRRHSGSVPTWHKFPGRRYISMLKYNLVCIKYRQVSLVTGFTVDTSHKNYLVLNLCEVLLFYVGILRYVMDSLIPGLSRVFINHLDVVLTLDTPIHYRWQWKLWCLLVSHIINLGLFLNSNKTEKIPAVWRTVLTVRTQVADFSCDLSHIQLIIYCLCQYVLFFRLLTLATRINGDPVSPVKSMTSSGIRPHWIPRYIWCGPRLHGTVCI